MSDVAVSSPITDAVLAALEDTDRPVGDGRKPTGQANLYPYCVLYAGTTRMQGTLVDPNEDGLHRIQVTSVGLTRESAEYLRDLVRPILLGRELAIDGHAVVWSELVTSQPVARDDDVTPAVFYAIDVVNLLVTPVAGS